MRSSCETTIVPSILGHQFQRMICPYCMTELTAYRFIVQGVMIVSTYHCLHHGDVVPIRMAP